MPQQAAQPQQSPAPPSASNREALIAAALGVVTAVAAGAVAVSATKAAAVSLAALTRLFVRWGYRRETIRWGLRAATLIVTPPGRTPDPTPGPAGDVTARAERTFAAWFLERTTARVQAAYAAGAAEGEPEAREARFIDQHLDAQARRRAAAQRVDAEAVKPGQVVDGSRVILKWRAHPDDKVTPECRAADGCWFYADTPPIIGYPGMPHGGTCRCSSRNAGSLAEVARGRSVDEAVRGMLEPDHRTHPGAGTALPTVAASA